MSYNNHELEPDLLCKPSKEKFDPEVTSVNARPSRRRFTAEYKVKIIKEAAEIRANHGSIGGLLRAEGLYSGQLNLWEKSYSQHEGSSLLVKRRGPQKKQPNPLQEELLLARKENDRLRFRLKELELLSELQKKVLLLFDAPSKV